MSETHYNPWGEVTAEQVASNQKEFEARERAIEEQEDSGKGAAGTLMETGGNSVCHDCGKALPDVRLRTDPYRADVYGDVSLYALCDRCVSAGIEDV